MSIIIPKELIAARAEAAAQAAAAQKQVTAIVFAALADAGTLDDTTIGEHAEVFVPWQAGVHYDTGKICTYGDEQGEPLLYRCLQAHDAQTGWEPPTVPALFKQIFAPREEYPAWSQPICAEDSYSIGDKCSYGGKKWVSTCNGNCWAPGVAGWDEVSE